MTTLLQISDPHFGTEQPLVVDALRQLIDRLRPEVLLMTGDITQRATRSQFDAAARFLAPLAVAHKLVIPGNHDIPLFDQVTRWLDPYRRYRRVFGDELEPSLARDDCLVITLNTTRRWRHKHGEVSAEQIERVADRVTQATPGQLRIVAAHQPLAVTSELDTTNLLRGHAQALKRWREAGVDIVLGGHIHLPFAVATAGARALWVVQAGTAVSTRVRGAVPNSVNVLRGLLPSSTERLCELQRWDFDAAQRQFRRVEVRVLQLSGLPT